MTDMKFILPGSDTITLAVHTVDKLLRAGDGDAALLYLYILKTCGQGTSTEAAAALGKGGGSIASASAVLSRLGLVKCDDGNDVSAPPQESESYEPRRYSSDEIAREIAANPSFSALVQEAQRSLGKILSGDEAERLLGMYDWLRLPPEVILQLITHCITESRGRGGGRMPSMRYIEKTAYVWEREGILTLDRAEEYLKALEMQKSVRGEMKRELQINNRELSTSEKRYVDSWIAMGFGSEAVEIAYDRTVLKTGMFSWGYIDSILNSWHGKGLHTPQEILEKDKKSDKNDPKKNTKAAEQKFGAPNTEDFERMKRLLRKIKED
ncbi:MAG: DnaD domain protein [Oscillospiraceae bacterium]|nr:DnaD domain protein [Oscillospiraceae bacterium]